MVFTSHAGASGGGGLSIVYQCPLGEFPGGTYDKELNVEVVSLSAPASVVFFLARTSSNVYGTFVATRGDTINYTYSGDDRMVGLSEDGLTLYAPPASNQQVIVALG